MWFRRAFKDVFRGISRAEFWGGGDEAATSAHDEIMESFSKIQGAVAKVLNVRRRAITKLFMNNTRYRIYFARNVLEEILRSAIQALDMRRRPKTQANLIEELRRESEELLDRKDYRLVEILLHSKNDRFANFVRIEGEAIELQRHRSDPAYLERALKDNNIRSGYIGNVFNYHVPYKSAADINFLLEKLRILDILIGNGGQPLTTSAVADCFRQNGWRCSEYFDFSFGIMVRENMIAGFNISAGSAGYVATELGEIVRNTLVSNMIYLENVFFGTFLPRGIKRRACDIYRGASQRHEWVAASIFHCWLLLRLVATAEREGKQLFFEEMRASVTATIDRILSAKNADPRIAAYALRHIERFASTVHS